MVVEPVAALTTVLTVRVADLDLGFPADVVGEVLRMVAITDLPGAPEVVAGIVDLRGETVPVLDLRRRLGRPPTQPGLDDRLVAVTLESGSLLLWVDAVHGLRSLEPGTIDPLEGDLAATPHLAGVARAPDGLLYVHAPTDFLTDREVAELDVALLAHRAGA